MSRMNPPLDSDLMGGQMMDNANQGRLAQLSGMYNQERMQLKQMILSQQHDIENLMSLEHE